MNRIKNKQNGFAMVEMLIALGVAAIVIVFAYVVFSLAMGKIYESRAITQINSIENGIHQLYANSYDYSDINTQAIIDSGISEKGNTIDDKIIASPWFGSNKDSIITVNPSINPGAFVITMAKVPKKSCTKVAAVFIQYGIKIGVEVVLTPVQIATACAKYHNSDINITF